MSTLLTALAGERPERLPIWFMRQAGRSLPEYRLLRHGVSMLDTCLRPDLVAEITAQPVRRHRVDAAIFFSDIMVPLKLAGVEVSIRPSVGPVFDVAYRDSASIAELVAHTDLDLGVIDEAVRATIEDLDVPLIGFAGAPFTLAAYLVEGRPSRDHLSARALMHADPAAWDSLMSWCAQVSGQFLEAQVAAGAAAVQLFDSWAGGLSRDDYVRYVLPYSRRVLENITVPTISFGTNNAHLLVDMAQGVSAVGVDYRLPLDQASAMLDDAAVLQGNIDPALLSSPWEIIEEHVRDVVEKGRRARAHIVNLGHGVPPETNAETLTRIVELVHSL